MGRKAIRSAFAERRNRHPARGGRGILTRLAGRRLRFEPLEDRHLLAVLTVNSLSDNTIAGNGLVTLREAILAANNNTTTDLGQTGSGADTIEFAPLPGAGTIFLNFGEYAVSEALTINGPGRDLLTIDAQESSRIFRIQVVPGPPLSFSGMTLAHGLVLDNGGAVYTGGAIVGFSQVNFSSNQASSGGGVYSENSITFTDCTFANNSATSEGGGFYAEKSNILPGTATVTVTDSRFNENSASTGGGFYIGDGALLSIGGSSLTGNTASGKGGGFYSYRDFEITDSTIAGNTARTGGGIQSYHTVKVTRCTISGNVATSMGGGVYAGRLGNVVAQDSIIEANVAQGADDAFMGVYSGGGGGIFSKNAVTITRSTIRGNQATAGSGGGIRTIGSGSNNSITDSQMVGNWAAQLGGGIRAHPGALNLVRSIISGNHAGSDGGGAYGGTISLASSTIADNISSGKGGGVNASTLTLAQSTISGNSAAGDGGGAYVRGTAATSLTESTISGNESGGDGGGLYVKGASTLTNATVSGNKAAGNGGGLYARGTVTVKHSTIAFNRSTAGSGGGVWNDNDTKTFRATIIANNTAAAGSPDLRPGSGTLDFRFNLLGDDSGTTLAEAHTMDVNGNLIGSSAGGGVIDPKLSTLFNFGGPTPTLALLPGSPAIDGISLTATTPTPTHVYELNGSYADAMGGPNLIPKGGTLTASGYQFGANQGPSLSGSNINASNYSIELTFTWAALGTGRQKILDFHNLSQDGGLYADGDGLRFANLAFAGGVFAANTPYTLVLSRDAVTNTVRAYVNGVEKWRFVDAAGDAVFDGPDKVMRFFRDDNVTAGSEAGSGFLDRVRIFNVVLTPAQIVGNPVFDGTPSAFDQRGTPYARVVEGDGLAGVRMDFGAFESQGVPSLSVYDYNDDGVVNAADYTVWRNARGQSGLPPFQGADGDGDGGITMADYNLWKSHFGDLLVTTPPGVGSAAALAVDAAEPMAAVEAGKSQRLPAMGELGAATVDRTGSQSLGTGDVAGANRQDAGLSLWLATVLSSGTTNLTPAVLSMDSLLASGNADEGECSLDTRELAFAELVGDQAAVPLTVI